jgi:riboflavin synthase
MFTGIVTDLGRVRSVTHRGEVRLAIDTAYDTDTIALGASLACSGACLTVVDKGAGWFAVEVSAETLSKTTIADWQAGTPVNLERALALGDELGGHLVSGHVDGTCEIVSRRAAGESLVFALALPGWLAPFVAAKGSIALDGVSLTVNEVSGDRFTVNIIPHTRERTTFGQARPGRRVNVEIDMLARYVRRALTYAESAEAQA